MSRERKTSMYWLSQRDRAERGCQRAICSSFRAGNSIGIRINGKTAQGGSRKSKFSIYLQLSISWLSPDIEKLAPL